MTRILVVDDDPMIVEGLVEMLRIESFDAAGALDRESAEKAMAAEFYPIVLADLRHRSRRSAGHPARGMVPVPGEARLGAHAESVALRHGGQSLPALDRGSGALARSRRHRDRAPRPERRRGDDAGRARRAGPRGRA